MNGPEFFSSSLWWLCPVLMIVVCFFMMRGRRGRMLCGFGFPDRGSRHISASDSAAEILNKRYASGEIDTEEYEEKKRTLTRSTESVQ
jgi:uncharacterized membrane protein